MDCYFEFMPLISVSGARFIAGQRVQRTDLPRSLTPCPMGQCVYCQAGRCDDAATNKGNSDAACHRMTNRKVLAMLKPCPGGALRENT